MAQNFARQTNSHDLSSTGWNYITSALLILFGIINRKLLFPKIAAIFVMIAGTYTPFTLSTLSGGPAIGMTAGI